MIVDQEAVVTSPVPLSTTPVTVATSNVPTPSTTNPGVAGVYAIARGHMPQFTAVPAGAVLSIAIIRADTGAVLSQTFVDNPGTSPSPISGAEITALIPQGVGQVALQVSSSTGTPGAYAASTSPILLEVDLNLGIG